MTLHLIYNVIHNFTFSRIKMCFSQPLMDVFSASTHRQTFRRVNNLRVCRCASVCVCSPAGGEAAGPGQTGDSQHSQETDRLPAGSAGRRRGEAIRQVAFCECSCRPPPAPPTLTSPDMDTADAEPSPPSLCFCSQKKLPLTILAQCLVEGAAVLGDDSLLG